MNRKDFYFLGKVVKTSGYKGFLVFFFDVDELSHYFDLEAVFVDIHGDLIPFAIREMIPKKGNTFFARLEEVDTEEEALALVGCELYLPLSYLPKLTGNKFYFHEVVGFKVVDKNKGEIGIIERFIEQGPQPLFSIKQGKKEILVPVSDEFIVQVDRKNRVILLNTPEGLIDVYL